MERDRLQVTELLVVELGLGPRQVDSTTPAGWSSHVGQMSAVRSHLCVATL